MDEDKKIYTEENLPEAVKVLSGHPRFHKGLLLNGNIVKIKDFQREEIPDVIKFLNDGSMEEYPKMIGESLEKAPETKWIAPPPLETDITEDDITIPSNAGKAKKFLKELKDKVVVDKDDKAIEIVERLIVREKEREGGPRDSYLKTLVGIQRSVNS